MYINFILLPFIILLGLLLPDDDRNRRLFIVIVLVVLSLESALRSCFLVADTFSYYEMFIERVPNMSWSDIWSGFIDRYFGEREHDIDYGYIILQKVIYYVTHDFQIFTFLSQLIFYIPMGIVLYKYSTHNRHIIFAFVFFVALLQVSAIGGGRQLLARGCWLMTFLMINEKKYVKGALWLLLGLSFHFSVLIVLMAFVLGFLNSKQIKTVHLLTIFSIPIVLVFSQFIVSYLGGFTGSERYAGYAHEASAYGMMSFVVLMELLSIICFFMLNAKKIDANVLLKQLYVVLPCLTLTTPLSIMDGALIRLGSYFHMFMMLIVPYAFDEFKDRKTVSFIYVLAISILVFLTLKDGGLKYYFYWQDNLFQY